MTQSPKDPSLAQAIQRAQTLLWPLLGPQPQKIYHLVESVGKHGDYPWSKEYLLGLYQKLFITHAALTELYFRCEIQGTHTLWIGPVSVCLLAHTDHTPPSLPAEERHWPNLAFYTNEQHFFAVTSEQVSELLQQFWCRFDARHQADEALAVLGLANGASPTQIRQRFRQLAARHHPDRGGDAQRFIDIRQAYECLQALQ